MTLYKPLQAVYITFARSVKFLSFLLEWVGDWWSSSAWDIRLDSKIRSQNVHFHDSFWRDQNLAATKLFLWLTGIDSAVDISSRAVRISSRTVRVFPAPAITSYPSYGNCTLMVFHGNCARGHTGHVIIYTFAPSQKFTNLSTGLEILTNTIAYFFE